MFGDVTKMVEGVVRSMVEKELNALIEQLTQLMSANREALVKNLQSELSKESQTVILKLLDTQIQELEAKMSSTTGVPAAAAAAAGGGGGGGVGGRKKTYHTRDRDRDRDRNRRRHRFPKTMSRRVIRRMTRKVLRGGETSVFAELKDAFMKVFSKSVGKVLVCGTKGAVEELAPPIIAKLKLNQLKGIRSVVAKNFSNESENTATPVAAQ